MVAIIPVTHYWSVRLVTVKNKKHPFHQSAKECKPRKQNRNLTAPEIPKNSEGRKKGFALGHERETQARAFRPKLN
ncbi:hypothetical protein VIGAN_05179200 [Vigna angularis var. angularis]|uniref:Uncharacterized protein n=1 Tax=Vigna angularis var. angularis TaxID=157739 RepID=A0A0S3S689_PHAAN|nr:hypothetical protein VIGAN_05179200 [Vigna angularis var. angularis]